MTDFSRLSHIALRQQKRLLVAILDGRCHLRPGAFAFQISHLPTRTPILTGFTGLTGFSFCAVPNHRCDKPIILSILFILSNTLRCTGFSFCGVPTHRRGAPDILSILFILSVSYVHAWFQAAATVITSTTSITPSGITS